jgi:hypothetical protein
MTTNQTLWTNTDQSRYFLIPEGQELAEGAFALRTFSGEERLVDEAALTSFEIDEEQAKAHSVVQVEQVAANARDAFSNYLNLLADRADALVAERAAEQEATQGTAKQEAEPPIPMSAELVYDLLGLSPQDGENPEKVEEQLGNLLEGIKTFVQGVTSEDAADVEPAREQMRAIREKFEAHGVGTTDQMETLPDRLRADFQAHKEKGEQAWRDEVAAALQEAAGALQEAATELGEEETGKDQGHG